MTNLTKVFDNTRCVLGEGPLWHPTRHVLLWFDIKGCKLFERNLTNKKAKTFDFDFEVSAAGWINDSEILVATSKSLIRFNLDTKRFYTLVDLEANNSITRSNDGRADPQGGFWIGTMGRQLEAFAGAIYRYYKGELRLLFPSISVPNSICFSPCGKIAYFADTALKKIMRVGLDINGWPCSDPKVFVDLEIENLSPDGSVIDSQGNLWNAQWGSSKIAKYDLDARHVDTIYSKAPLVTCPSFGALDLRTLFFTTAREGLSDEVLKEKPLSGSVFSVRPGIVGKFEHRVNL